MVNEPSQGDLMTSEDFAQRAKVSRSTVERWRFEGHGPEPIKLAPRTVRYRRTDVERFLGLADVAGADQ